MGRKKRVSSLEEMRNGMPQMHMGDKLYSNPEYSDGYWKKEGGHPSYVLRKRIPNGGVQHTKTLELTEEQLLWKPPKRATFAEKQREMERRADMTSVSLLPKARKHNALAKYSSLQKNALSKAEAS